MFGPPNVQKLLEKRDVAGLARALKHRDAGIRAGAAEALLGVLEGGDPKERAVAAAALGDAGDERAVEPLIAALGDEDWQLKAAAVEALGKLRDSRAVDPLLTELRKEAGVSFDQSARLRAALEQIGGERVAMGVTSHFLDGLRFASERGRVDLFRQRIETQSSGEATLNEQYLIEAMPEFGLVVSFGQAAVETLTAALDDRDEFVRTGAAVALERIGVAVPIPTGPLAAPREERRRAIRGGLEEPYCSQRCYELGGETIAREQITRWEGSCSVCRRPMQLGVDPGASMVCFRPGEFLYFCGTPSCREAVSREVSASISCVVCGSGVI